MITCSPSGDLYIVRARQTTKYTDMKQYLLIFPRDVVARSYILESWPLWHLAAPAQDEYLEKKWWHVELRKS